MNDAAATMIVIVLFVAVPLCYLGILYVSFSVLWPFLWALQRWGVLASSESDERWARARARFGEGAVDVVVEGTRLLALSVREGGGDRNAAPSDVPSRPLKMRPIVGRRLTDGFARVAAKCGFAWAGELARPLASVKPHAVRGILADARGLEAAFVCAERIGKECASRFAVRAPSGALVVEDSNGYVPWPPDDLPERLDALAARALATEERTIA